LKSYDNLNSALYINHRRVSLYGSVGDQKQHKMSSVNKVILLGRLGKDPEVKRFDSGKVVATFSLATSEKYKDQEETQWHNIVLWGTTAELAEKYLTKGSQLFVEGKVKYRTYDDKDGAKRYVTEIAGERITFVGGAAKTQENAPQGQIEQGDADLPF